VTREQFERVAGRLRDRHPSTRALEWVFAVPHAGRAAREARCSVWRPGFRFTERGRPGELVRAADRPVYYPVCLVEPYEGNEEAIGFDLGSDSTRLRALSAARDSGVVRATPGIRLIQDSGDETGFLALLPVYRGQPRTLEQRRADLLGFVAGVFRVRDVVRASALSERLDDAYLTLVDVTEPDQHTVLFTHAVESDPLGEDWTRRRALAEVMGRRWGLVVTASEDFVSSRRSWAPPLFVVGGLLLTALGFVTYVTRRRAQRATRDLERRERELTQTMRLSILGELMTGVTHEVSQPLTAIASYAGASVASLSSGRADDAKLLEWSRHISEQARSCGEIIARIRRFARTAEGEHERFEIEPAVRESAELARLISSSRPVDTTFRIDAPGATVTGDRMQIQQVLVHILRNAYEAAAQRPGGDAMVAVRTRRTQEGMLVVTVTDNGPGIAEEDVERVFDAFYTTKRGELGLGLAVSRSIVEEHRGRLWAAANEGPGVTFHFVLPADPA
jgi:signal transduction histidine kinase